MQEGGNFTIDFIQEEYRESVKSLMEILCIEMKQAYELFIMSGCNLQAAINRHTNPEPDQHINGSLSNSNGPRNRRNDARSNFNQEVQGVQSYLDEDEDDEFYSFPVARRRPAPPRVEQESEFDAKFNRFLQFKQKKKTFNKNYKIRRQYTNEESMSIGMRIFDKKPKRVEQKNLLELRPYVKEIEKDLLGKRCYIDFGKGSMSESLQQSFKRGKPLLVYHLNFDIEQKKEQTKKKNNNTKNPFKAKKMVIDISQDDPSQKLMEITENQPSRDKQFKDTKKNKFFKNLLLDTKTARIMNEGFENFIVDVQNYYYESYFREYFDKSKRKENFLLVLRVNVFEQIELVGRVNLDESLQKIDENNGEFEPYFQKIREDVKKLQQRIKLTFKQQTHLQQRYRLLQLGIDHYDYIKPPSTAEKIKIKEDRQIIRQQQQEFFNIENQIIEQKLKELSREEEEQNQKVSRQEVMEKRKCIRGGLQSYSNGDPNVIMIKFRLPSGKNVILNVSMKEKVSYLFDYIYSLDMESIGLEEEEEGGYCDRKFDIIRPEDRLSLEEKTSSTLEEVFEGSLMESLNVKEK